MVEAKSFAYVSASFFWRCRKVPTASGATCMAAAVQQTLLAICFIRKNVATNHRVSCSLGSRNTVDFRLPRPCIRTYYGLLFPRPASRLLTAIRSKLDALVHRDIQSILLRLGIDLSNDRAMDFSGGARSSGGELTEQQIMQEVSAIHWCLCLSKSSLCRTEAILACSVRSSTSR